VRSRVLKHCTETIDFDIYIWVPDVFKGGLNELMRRKKAAFD
jgi:hypothetical protein